MCPKHSSNVSWDELHIKMLPMSEVAQVTTGVMAMVAYLWNILPREMPDASFDIISVTGKSLFISPRFKLLVNLLGFNLLVVTVLSPLS